MLKPVTVMWRTSKTNPLLPFTSMPTSTTDKQWERPSSIGSFDSPTFTAVVDSDDGYISECVHQSA